jgi:putative DNA primase/helicase
MKRRSVDAGIVKNAASGRWLEMLRLLAPQLEDAVERHGRHGPCPVHGGTDGFRLFRDADRTGGGVCNTCGAKSDGFALLQWVNDWSFPETVLAVAQVLGIAAHDDRSFRPAPTRIPRSASVKERDMIQARRSIEAVWHKSVPLHTPQGAPALEYLQNRGIDVMPDPSRVRCHPALGYYERVDGKVERTGVYPALVARFSDETDRLATIHRVYVTTEGRKAPVAEAKKMMRAGRPLQGGAVRLGPAFHEVCIAEGIETALAVQQRTGCPTWAALSATLLELWIPPSGVRSVIIWADRDRSGRGLQAASSLEQRLEARGVHAVINLPEGPLPEGRKSVDWADAVCPEATR